MYISEACNKLNMKSKHGIFIYIDSLKRKYNCFSKNEKIYYIHRMFIVYNYDNLVDAPTEIMYNLFCNIGKYFYIYYKLLVNKYDNDALLMMYKKRFIDIVNEFGYKNRNYGRVMYKKDILGKYRKTTHDKLIL